MLEKYPRKSHTLAGGGDLTHSAGVQELMPEEQECVP